MKGDAKLTLVVLITTMLVAGVIGGIVLIDIMTEPISAAKSPVGECASTFKNSGARACHALAR